MTVSPYSTAADLLDPPDWTRDPAGWVRSRLHDHPWSKQVEVMEAVRDHRRVVVESCHSAGKSRTAAWLTEWWLDSHPIGSAFVVTTAPTFAQVRAVLWREIGRVQRKGRLRGRVNQTERWMDDELVAFGRKPSDYDQSAFQGIHALFVLVILDEADGIPEQLYIDANSLLANDGCRILAIGNPDQPESHMSRIATPGSGWHLVTIDGLESPNFTDEKVPNELRKVLIGPTYVEEVVRDYGEGSPIYLSKVRGQRPRDSTDTVVRYSDATACTLLDLPAGDPVELGVDVGRGGDESVIRERRGVKAGREWRSRHDDTMGVVGEVHRAIEETGATVVKVDVIGVGAGVFDRLREQHRAGELSARPVAVNVGEASTNPKRYRNLRAQLWWEVGRLLSEGRVWDLSSMTNRDVTVGQLIMPKWSTDSSGRIVVESKDDIRERLGRSPDNADALLLAFYSQHEPATFASSAAVTVPRSLPRR